MGMKTGIVQSPHPSHPYCRNWRLCNSHGAMMRCCAKYPQRREALKKLLSVPPPFIDLNQNGKWDYVTIISRASRTRSFQNGIVFPPHSAIIFCLVKSPPWHDFNIITIIVTNEVMITASGFNLDSSGGQGVTHTFINIDNPIQTLDVSPSWTSNLLRT